MPNTQTIVIPVKADASQAKSGLTDIKSQLLGLAKDALPIIGLGTAVKWMGEQAIGSMKDTIAYANEVRGLSQVTGMTAEESSRLIQVMDDHKISTESLMKATKTLAKQGLQPNIATIGKLSDEYRGLNNQVDKNNFLIKNFGKEGLKYAEVLSLGSEKLHEEAKAVDEALIANDKFLLEARRAEMELDNWQDRVAALRMEIGIGLIGVLDGSTVAIQKNAQEIFKAANGYEFNTNMMGRYTEAQRAAWEEAKKQATEEWMKKNAVEQGTAAIQEQTQAQADLEAQIKATTDANNAFIGTVKGMADENRRYTETQAPLRESQQALLAEKLKLIKQGYNPESEKIGDINKKMEENKKAMQENQAKHKEWINAKIGDLLLLKLSQDGLTNAETGYYLNFLTKTGQITKTDQAMAASIISNADDIAAGFDQDKESVDAFHARLYALMERYQRALQQSLVPLHYTYSITGQGSFPTPPKGSLPGAGLPGNPIIVPKGSHATGGAVLAGQLYSVNEMGKPEYFLPNTSGQIKPNPSSQTVIAHIPKRDMRQMVMMLAEEIQKA